MAEFLFEIFCEEIPARMQARAGVNLEQALVDGMSKAGLKVTGMHHWAGPRRLGFRADIPMQSPDVSEERKGPRVGSPEKALAGFMRGAGLTDISQAEIRSDKKGEHYVAVIEKSGQASAAIITDLVRDIMNNFPWPKSMKSGSSNFRWVRPLQSMMCMLDGDVIPVKVGGVTAGNFTQGHRRHGRGPFMVKTYAAYKKSLETQGHVLLEMADRKAKILKDAEAACSAAGLALVEDEGLLNEVAGLAEWPVVILGDMDPSFLELPGEVIRLSMRNHQKYFAVKNKDGSLAPHFIVVANQIAPDGGQAIAAGNSRVLSARLADAQFFQSEDAKKKLIEYYDKLDTVVFHKKLGSIRDKAERVAALARELAPKVGADPDAAEQAAKLAKCDLVTQTVIEFTSLQGQIGRLMYEKEGGDADIAIAIEDHYKPQGPSDAVPTNPVAVAVALADKLDTLVGFWAIDEKPTGSKDPFALRRAALGVVRIILENDVRLFLFSVFRQRLDRVGAFNVADFIQDRLKVHLRDKGIRYDYIDAVYEDRDETSEVSAQHSDLVAIVNRTEALQAFLSTSNGENLLAGYKRAANILKAESKKGALPVGKVGKGTQAEETALYDALQDVQAEIEAALSEESYSAAMTSLSKLRAPIDDFFDKVTVNDEDPKKRENRLLLLSSIRDTAFHIGNFDKIDG